LATPTTSGDMENAKGFAFFLFAHAAATAPAAVLAAGAILAGGADSFRFGSATGVLRAATAR
jgi:hypothetical protein